MNPGYLSSLLLSAALTAAAMSYRAIADAVRKEDYNCFTKRCYTSSSARAKILLKLRKHIKKLRKKQKIEIKELGQCKTCGNNHINGVYLCCSWSCYSCCQAQQGRLRKLAQNGNILVGNWVFITPLFTRLWAVYWYPFHS
jgi:hypothetical protein